METRNMALIFAVAAVMAITLFTAGCAQGVSPQPPSNNSPSPGSLPSQTGTGQQTQASPPSANGQMIYTISDVASDMGAVARIDVTVSSIIMHRSGNDWSTGWATITSVPKTYDLIALKASGAQSLLADVNMTPGTYDQMRLSITSVMVTDSNGVHSAKLPSGDLTIKGQFTVSANSTTHINLDFLADKSLHVTGNGQYILAPVIHLAEKNNAEVDSSNKMDVKVRGGRMHTDMEVGMNENGEMGEGMMISGNLNLSIGDDGRIRVNEKKEDIIPYNSSLAVEGETCGGVAGITCQPGLQCITSGMIGAEGACSKPAPASQDLQQCPSQRNENCIVQINPVCGKGTDTKATFRDYINACEACSTRSNAVGYYMGTCENK